MFTPKLRPAFGWLMALAAILVLLTGCSEGSSATIQSPPLVQAASQATPQSAPPPPKVVVITLKQSPDTLNPLYTDMWSARVLSDLYLATGLFTYNERNEPIPWVAKEIPSLENGGLSPDGKIITYRLREDARWSDGVPLTADDYVFTWQMMMNDRNAVISRAPFDTAVDKVEAAGPYTLIVTLKRPFAPWQARIFSTLNSTNAIPRHILERVFANQGTLDDAAWNKKPSVGAGPFVFKEWQPDQIVFAANENFWLGRPRLDEITVRLVSDDAAQLAALKSGQSHLGAFIAYGDMPDLEASGAVVLASVSSGYRESLFFNLSAQTETAGHPALQDARVRRAIVMAIDREKICQELLAGRTWPVATFWAGTPFGNPAVTLIPYNPDEARRLLDEAGWLLGEDGIRAKDGIQLRLRYVSTNHYLRVRAQEMVQQMLGAVGIDTTLSQFDSAAFFASTNEGGPIAWGRYDIEEHTESAQFPDPTYAGWLCAQTPAYTSEGVNHQFLCDNQLEELFAWQSETMSMGDRAGIYYEISRLLDERVYWASLWDDPDWWAVSGRMRQIRLSGATPFWNSYEWDIE